MGKTKRDIVIVGATIFVFAFLLASKNVFRSVAPPGALVARIPTPTADAATFVDDTQAEFDAGTHGDTQWNGTSSWVELTATGLTNKTGTYTSSVKDAGSTSSWDTFAWTPQAPYGKELPNSGNSETAYPGGNSSMTNIAGLWHLNESSGTVYDSSGNNNNSTSGSPTYGATGKLKTALSFSGSNYISIPSSTSLQVTSGITFSMWVKRARTGTRELFAGKGNANGPSDTSYWLEFNAANYIAFYLSQNDSTDRKLTATASAVSDTTTWHHIAGTWDGTTQKIYLDGTVDPTTATWTGSIGTGNETFSFGRMGGYSFLYFNGLIDEAALWGRALSATEVADVYRRGARSLKFQMRSCDDAACSGETLVGPDGTAGDYYEELDNTGLGTPSFTITNIANNRYFQYKAFFDTDSTAAGPTLKSVTPTYTTSSINVSGTVYTDEGTTAMTTTPTVRLKVNGLGSYSTTAAANGTYTISGVTPPSSGDVLTVYLDGATEKAALVTRYSSGSPSGVDLYQNRLILRHEDAGPITNANIGQYDKDDDTDLHFTSNAGALTVDNDTELHIPAFYLFTPGGTVTTSPGGSSPGGDIHIGSSATFTVAANAVSVGGSWDNNGTYSASSGQTTTFTATGTGKTVEAGSSTYQHITFNGSGGGWTVQTDNMTVAGNLSLTTGGAWTLASGRTLEVRGTFANSIPSVTTWTGSTLYLNSGTSYTVGSKTQAAETYGALQIGADTTVRMWNASSTAVTTP